MFYQDYSRLYGLRGLALVRHFNHTKLQKQLKIFIKTVINFSSYLIPYILTLACLQLVITSLAMNIFKQEAYIGQALQHASGDAYIRYSITSYQLLFVSDWSSVAVV